MDVCISLTKSHTCRIRGLMQTCPKRLVFSKPSTRGKSEGSGTTGYPCRGYFGDFSELLGIGVSLDGLLIQISHLISLSSVHINRPFEVGRGCEISLLSSILINVYTDYSLLFLFNRATRLNICDTPVASPETSAVKPPYLRNRQNAVCFNIKVLASISLFTCSSSSSSPRPLPLPLLRLRST